MPDATSLDRSIGLDLIRAIAITLVLVCHVHLMEASWSKQPLIIWIAVCGLIGVQLFFVLSGFLIGRILIELAGRPAGGTAAAVTSWRIFMTRRWLRTLPLYWLVLALLAWVWPPLFWIPHNGQLLAHLVGYGTLTQNLFRPLHDGWFATSWSLAVEEWFYLLFSALLLGLARLMPATRALVISLAIFLLTPAVLRNALLGTVSSANDEHVVPLWFDGLAIGVIAAWVLPQARISRRMALVLLAVGLALTVYVWRGGLASVPGIGLWLKRAFNNDVLSIGFALCLPAALSLSTLPKPLSLIVRRMSAWSYCLYLVHLPLLEIGGYYGLPRGLSPRQIGAACLACALALSWASWRFFEQPILALRPRDPARLRAALVAQTR